METLPSHHGTLRPFGVTPGLTESAPYRRDLGLVLEKLIAAFLARIRHSAMRYVFPLRQSHFGGTSRLVTVLERVGASLTPSPLH